MSVRLPGPDEQQRVADALDEATAAAGASRAVEEKLRNIKVGLVADLLRGADSETVGDLSSYVGSGLTPKGGSSVYVRSGVVFLRSQNVHFEGLVLDDVAHISDRTHAAMARSEVFPNDVLLNITGASIGRCCLVPHDLGAANVNQHVCAIRLGGGTRFDAMYLAEALGSHFGQAQIDRLNAGGSREGLNYDQVRSIEIPWHTPGRRREAASIIEEQNRRIRAQAAVTAKLELVGAGMAADLLYGGQAA
jgi:type I restriction enzyme S subunit